MSGCCSVQFQILNSDRPITGEIMATMIASGKSTDMVDMNPFGRSRFRGKHLFALWSCVIVVIMNSSDSFLFKWREMRFKTLCSRPVQLFVKCEVWMLCIRIHTANEDLNTSFPHLYWFKRTIRKVLILFCTKWWVTDQRRKGNSDSCHFKQRPVD